MGSYASVGLPDAFLPPNASRANNYSPAGSNAAGSVSVAGGTNPSLQENKQNTAGTTSSSITRDPFQEFLFNLIGQQAQSSGSYVPQYTQDALANFTANPASSAAQFFPALAQPLMAALRPTEDRETAQLQNMFRTAGGTGDTPMQSGAFANEARLLIGDQANRRQQTLAQNYIPLTNQISGNINNAIQAGLQFPQANTAALKTIAPLAASIQPNATSTNSNQQVEGVNAGSNGVPSTASSSGGGGGGSGLTAQQLQNAANAYSPFLTSAANDPFYQNLLKQQNAKYVTATQGGSSGTDYYANA
jgi:hypothetical protein